MQCAANTDVLKEPRGFIKFLEIILAICAFATAVGPIISTSISCLCPESSKNYNITLQFHYPYKLQDATFEPPICLDTENSTTAAIPPDFSVSGDCQSSSEFFVFVGVAVFLYSLAAVSCYVLLHEQYIHHAVIPKIDFIITVIFTLLWLISSSAFADAVAKIKHYTDPDWVWKSDESMFSKYLKTQNIACSSTEDGNYAALNVSVIFGFLNMVVWCGNNWFLYKETNWFGEDLSSPPQQQMPSSASDVQPKA